MTCQKCGGGVCSETGQAFEQLEGDNFLGKYPAGVTVKHRPIDPKAHTLFLAALKAISPERR